jgi:hypothetical protein
MINDLLCVIAGLSRNLFKLLFACIPLGMLRSVENGGKGEKSACRRHATFGRHIRIHSGMRDDDTVHIHATELSSIVVP